MFQSLLSDPLGYLTELLLRLPAILIAICMHESAHAWMADKCGDPTGRLSGRISLNPVRHFDLVGMLCMFFIGLGWAKPTPVNPLNYRKYRRDDLLVSIAGVVTNILLALLSAIGVYCIFTSSLLQLQEVYNFRQSDEVLFQIAFWNPDLVAKIYGSIVGYLYQMLVYMVVVNVGLAVFNLIPLPPLDGYHVLNDIVLKRPLFAQGRTMAISSGILLVLMVTDILPNALGYVNNFIFESMGSGFYWLIHAMGVI